MRSPALLLSIAAVTMSWPLLAQIAPNLRPGRYETSAQMEMAGKPMMSIDKDVQCITADDL
jgi:hypothetical protein